MPASQRLPIVDVLKVVAAQAIVLHHFSLYGPMSTYARPLAPQLIDALADDGRLAVQVFLVIGGFLAARALAPDGLPAEVPLITSLRKRWLRLALPYWAALICALLASALARQWASLPHTPPAPSAAQVLANVLMLQDLFGLPALSAGFWYVAIDLQLFATMLGLMWSLRRIGLGAYVPVAVTLGAAAGLLLFNTDPSWDPWGVYFLGAYGLGALAWWSSASQAHTAQRWLCLALIAVLTAAALGMLWRTRIAVAACTAFTLALFSGVWSQRRPERAWSALNWLSDRSYALFLVHYPVALLCNAAADRWLPHTPAIQAFALLLTWVASMLASHVMFVYVEVGGAAWISRLAKPLTRTQPALPGRDRSR